MTNLRRLKSDIATVDKRETADKVKSDNRNRNDELTRERRDKADKTVIDNRARNDQTTADRREIKDDKRDMALAMSLVLIALIVVTFFIFM
jgi:hypothetical protein